MRWLHTNPELDNTKDDLTSVGHGTCMLARMGGHSQGIAKNSNPIIVRMARNQSKFTVFLDGLAQILNDIGPGRKRAVLSMSFGITMPFSTAENPDESDAVLALRKSLANILRQIADKGVLPIAAVGNDSGVSKEKLLNTGECSIPH